MHNVNDAAVYLCELVCPYQPTNTLRSANNNMLEVKRTRTKETVVRCRCCVPRTGPMVRHAIKLCHIKEKRYYSQMYLYPQV